MLRYKRQFYQYSALVLTAGVLILIFSRYTTTHYFFKEKTRLSNGGRVDEVWRKIDSQLYIYSAYYDQRANKNGVFGQVQIMAFEKKSLVAAKYCYFQYDTTRLCSDEPAKHTLFRTYERSHPKELYYNPSMYSCVLPNAEVPNAVGISSEKGCTVKTSRIRVNFNKWFPVKEFGVCVHSPLFGVDDYQFVAGFIELHRILGAEWFSFYIYSASARVLKLLRRYHADGLLEVAANWGRGMPNARYYGQDLSVQDCLYRNLYRVKYLVYVDLDEVIFPNKHPNWHSLMNELDNGKTFAFYFLHVALFNNTRDPRIAKFRQNYGRCDASTLLQTPRFLSYTIRSTRTNKNKCKLIVKPLAIRALRIHWVSEFFDQYRNRSKFVDAEVASMLHYRVQGLDKFRKRTTVFKKVQSLAPKVFPGLKTRLCRFEKGTRE